MLVLWYQLGEPTLPASRNSWPFSITTLSCHIPPPCSTHNNLLWWKQTLSRNQISRPIPGPKSYMTSLLTQMLAQKLALVSPSETNGEPGASYPAGKEKAKTSAGQKPWASSFSYSPYFKAALQTQITKSLEITKVSLKVGGKVGAIIPPQTKSSKWYMKKVSTQASPSTPVTSLAKKIQQTSHPAESMAQKASSYHPLPSHTHSC